jgi:hypothetical protein
MVSSCMQIIIFIKIRSVVFELNHIDRRAWSLPYAIALETYSSETNIVTRSIRSVFLAAVTVYSAPDDGRKGRPKHVEHTCSC